MAIKRAVCTGMTDRQLDALVAEKVMGKLIWPEHRDYKCYSDGPPMVVSGPCPKKHPDAERNCLYGPVPHYSTSIAEAWEVVKEVGGPFELLADLQRDFAARARFGIEQYIYADTAPRAICLAALRLKGVEVDS